MFFSFCASKITFLFLAEIVKEACTSRLLQAWLKLFEGNILDLLKALDVEGCVPTAEAALSALFETSPNSELVANFDLLDEKWVTCNDNTLQHSSLV